MADQLDDMFDGLKQYFTSQFPSAQVEIAFKDERLDEARTYPAISLQIFDFQAGNDRRYSGLPYFQQNNEAMTEATLTRPPVPIDVFFQLDTFAEKRLDDWSMAAKLLSIFNSRYTGVVSPSGRKLWLMPQTVDALDEIEGNSLFRKAYRFFVPVWFDNAAAAEKAWLVLTQIVNMNGLTYTRTAVA